MTSLKTVEGEIQDSVHVSKVHVSWLLRAVTAAGGRRGMGGGTGPETETGRKGGRATGVGVVICGGTRRREGRWLERKKGGRRGWGRYEVCTRLSAPGVPCGPGSGVREG